MNHLLTIGEGQLHLLLDNCFICCILHQSSGFWTQGVWVKPVFLYKGFSITFWTTCNSLHILQITGKYWSDSNLMGSQTPLSGQLCPQLDFKKCRKDGRSWGRERCCWGAVGRRMAEEGGGVKISTLRWGFHKASRGWAGERAVVSHLWVFRVGAPTVRRRAPPEDTHVKGAYKWQTYDCLKSLHTRYLSLFSQCMNPADPAVQCSFAEEIVFYNRAGGGASRRTVADVS